MAAGEQVPVDVEGRLNFRVAQERLDRLGICSSIDQQRGEGMSALVQRDRGEKFRIAGSSLSVFDLPRVERAPCALGPVVNRGSDERLAGRPPEHKVSPGPAGALKAILKVTSQDRQRQHAEAIANREVVEGLGWRARRQRLPGAEERERMFGERLREQTAKLNELVPPGSEVRREHEIAGQLLAEREEKMLLAARLSPPAYVVRELGERPADSGKAKAWDRGVRDIESYRNERGVKDKDSALGRRPEDWLGRTSHDHAQDRLREAQRRLDRIRQSERSMQRSREMSRGLDLGIGR